MKKSILMILVVFFITVVHSHAGTVIVADSDFVGGDWTYSQWVTGGPDDTNWAVAAMGTVGFNAVMTMDIHSYTSGKSVWGVALKNDFTFDPAASGAIESIKLTLDFQTFSSSGAGQTVDIVILQDGHYYGMTVGNTGLSSTWSSLTSAELTIDNVSHSWAEGSDEPDDTLQLPDFSGNGAAMQFGFACGNHLSGTRYQQYDHWQIEITTVPVPSAWSVLGIGLLGVAGFRRSKNGSPEG